MYACLFVYFVGMYKLYFSGDEYIIPGFICSLMLRRWEEPLETVLIAIANNNFSRSVIR